jgi:hypothetical protein
MTLEPNSEMSYEEMVKLVDSAAAGNAENIFKNVLGDFTGGASTLPEASDRAFKGICAVIHLRNALVVKLYNAKHSLNGQSS